MNSWIGNLRPFFSFLLPLVFWPRPSLAGVALLFNWSLSINEILVRLINFYFKPLLLSRKLLLPAELPSLADWFWPFLLVPSCSRGSHGSKGFIFEPLPILGRLSAGSSSLANCLMSSGVVAAQSTTSNLLLCFSFLGSIFYYDNLTAYSCLSFLCVWMRLSLDDKLWEPLFSAELPSELAFFLKLFSSICSAVLIKSKALLKTSLFCTMLPFLSTSDFFLSVFLLFSFLLDTMLVLITSTFMGGG